MRTVAWAALAVLALVPRAWADFVNGQNASIVLGQPNFTAKVCALSQNSLCFVPGAAFDASGHLWIADLADGRVVRFSPPFSTGMNANIVIGQPDFISRSTVASQSTLFEPNSIAFDVAGDLWVGDDLEGRVLMFQPPFSNGMNASLVLGQTNFTSTTTSLSQSGLASVGRGTGLAFDSSGSLWVADERNSRVLRYSPPFANGMNADLVIGQPDFVSSGTACAANRIFISPDGIAFDSLGDLWLVDANRVLMFSPPFTSGMAASLVLGEPNMTTCSFAPPSQSALVSNAALAFDPLGNLWSADQNSNGNRVLRFSPPFSNGMNASLVLGQPTFTSTQAVTSQNGMSEPGGLSFANGSLWVTEIGNNRATRFDNVPSQATTLAAVTLASSTVQLSWLATDNPFGAAFSGSYAIQYSTDPAVAFSTTAAQISVSTANVSPFASQTYVVGGLLANTTYFLRLWSANVGLNYSPISNGATAATLAPAPVAGSPAAPGVFLSSITAQWGALPASPPSATAEGYRLDASSTNFGAGLVYSSATAAVAASTLTVSGLALNTTYYLRVGSLNWAGALNATTLGQTATLAAAPSALAVGTVSSTSVSLSWSANGNPGWTPYEVSLSTDNFQTSFSTPVAFAANLTASATALSLAGATTYYFRVRAQNLSGVATTFSGVVSTVTLPGLVTSISTSAPSTTALSWSWAGAGPAVQSYAVYAASNAALVGTTGATSFGLTALSTNTAYGLVIGAVDAAGAGPLSAPVTAYTLAAPPTATAFQAVYLSSLTVSWTPNGNPGNTVYEVRRATDGVSFALVASQTSTLLADGGPLPSATYYYKIRALNGSGLATANDVAVSTFIAAVAPRPPSGLAATNPGGTTVTLTWNPSPSANLLQYDLYWDAGTGAVNYTATYSTVAANAASYTTTLSLPGTYYFALRAKSANGLEESNTNVRASIVLVPAAPFPNWVQAQLRFPASGRTVWGNRLTLYGVLTRGLSASQIQFQYRSAASTTTPFVAVPAAEFNNPVQKPPYFVHWDVTGLPQGDYEVRAVASNGAGLADPSPPTSILTVNSAAPAVQDSLVAGAIQHSETVNNAVSNTVFLGGLNGQTLLVSLPAGAVSSTTVAQITSPAPAVSAPTYLTATGLSLQITLQSGQSQLGVPASLTASYQDDDNDGLVDGTLARVDRLAFMTYSSSSGQWVKEAPSTIDAVNKTVTAQTGHFSLFGVFGQAAADLSSVRVYPVPFVPNGGNADRGKPFNAADPTSGIIFDNLTQSARVSVFTVTGELVWETTTASTSGKVQWDAKNSSGRDVATGGYIAVVRDLSSGQRVVRKIAIIR